MSGRLSRLPVPHHLSQSEAIGYLRRGVFEDAVKFGWLKACVRKTGRGRDSVFYRWADVEAVSLRVASGEYPGFRNADCRLRIGSGKTGNGL